MCRSPRGIFDSCGNIFDQHSYQGTRRVDQVGAAQGGCWNASGTPVTCSGTGQDGELQRGVDWPSPRFAGNGDGTVTDILTGLVWLQDANCFGSRTWTQALADANGLMSGQCGLTDGSVATDWRLPNIKELLSVVDYGVTNPALPLGHPFTSVQSDEYWSSTTIIGLPAYAWTVYMVDAYTYDENKTGTFPVWPVRGGQ